METFKQRLKMSIIHAIIFLILYIPFNFIANDAWIDQKVLLLVGVVGLLYGFIIHPYIVKGRK